MNWSKRSMSITPTPGATASNRSGRWLVTAPTSRPPLDRPDRGRPLGGGDAVGLQIFAGGDEVVEHVLLVGEPAGVVPGVAIFAAAAMLATT